MTILKKFAIIKAKGGVFMEEQFIITEIKRVAMVGKNEYTEKSSTFSKNLQYNELIFHFSGHITVYFGDLVLEDAPNTIRFLPKGEVSRYEVVRKEHGECILVAFSADRPIAPQAFVRDVAQNEKIGALFKKLFSTWVGKGQGYYFSSLSLLYRIFAELQSEDFVPSRHYEKIKPAVQMIHDRFLYEPLSVGALAAACHMGESYFQRLFKEKYGMSPKKYIIQLKVNHACELLRMERYNVSQVAEMSGFSDVYFFSRQFKFYMGVTPTGFIKKYVSSK